MGAAYNYNIAADGDGNSPLTGTTANKHFTVAELEVFSVTY